MTDSDGTALPCLFIETSIFIWRMNRPRAVRRRIDQRLRHSRPVTSTYVRAEYIHTVLGAAVRLHALLVERRDVPEAAARWRSEVRGGQADLGHWLIEDFLARAEDWEEARRALAQLIETEILAWFDDVGCELTDATCCEEAGLLPCRQEEAYVMEVSFPPRGAPQGLQSFLVCWRESLESLSAALHRQPGGHWRRICTSLERILQGHYDLGIRAWQRLADLVISLEAAACGCSVYTTNLAHYRPICEVLGVGVVPETASEAPPGYEQSGATVSL